MFICAIRSAPPDKAATILKKMGHPDVSPKLLRRWYKEGTIPGVDTGHKILLPLAPIIALLEGRTKPEVTSPNGQSQKGGVAFDL